MITDLDSDAKIHLEHFQLKELIVNITKHELVPKHELLEDGDVTQLLQRYRCKLSQLPKILVTDPVAKYYGLRRGQVVRILRRSETAGTYITYRYVI